MTYPALISLHGGHSGQFCSHAKDCLEDLIQAYIQKGFKQVGISEHMPPPTDQFLYPDEIRIGLNARDLIDRFARYFKELDRLKIKYKDKILIYKGFETETLSTGFDFIKELIQQFNPDYIVGSVHHVNDICFDYSREGYEAIAKTLGSVEAMYLAYFDAQLEMIEALRPFVVGHFDLIRIFDKDFETRINTPGIKKKIRRNLERIKALDLVLDYNLRPLSRGEDLPYPGTHILDQAKNLGIRVVPGDDAHSAEQAGAFVAEAIQEIEAKGFSTCWPAPEIKP
ncbi:MAG: histidinol-phosphatase [Desulfobacter sp.]|nr:histidinol-phosphatase [Desulfobacter sp.]